MTRHVCDTDAVLRDVHDERIAQTVKHGNQQHLPDGTGPNVEWQFGTRYARAERLADWYQQETQAHAKDGTVSFLDILLEEVAEAFAEADPVKLRAELVQVAAVAVQWVEAIDQRPPCGCTDTAGHVPPHVDPVLGLTHGERDPEQGDPGPENVPGTSDAYCLCGHPHYLTCPAAWFNAPAVTS